MRLRDQGVDASLITALRGSGYAMKADDIVQLAQHGIDADYVMEISTAGLRRIEPEDWIRLHDAGVDGRFVSAVLELRGSIATSDLIQMKQSGESPRRERTRTR